MSDSARFYDSNGVVVSHVPKKKGDGVKKANIATARELNLYPSVTTILGVLAKPGLDKWKHRQITDAAFDLQGLAYTDPDKFHSHIIDKAFQQVDDAADLGTRIHTALEDHFQGKDYDKELSVYVEAVEKWVNDNEIQFNAHEVVVVDKLDGFAGRTDADISRRGVRGLLDWKSRKTTPGKPCTPWETEPCQLAAYFSGHFGAIHKPSDDFAVNVFISTTEPGRIEAAWYDCDELTAQLEFFRHCAAIWRHLNRHDPRQ